jgi:hypothetical protein
MYIMAAGWMPSVHDDILSVPNVKNYYSEYTYVYMHNKVNLKKM